MFEHVKVDGQPSKLKRKMLAYLDVVNDEFFEAVGANVTGLGGGSVTDLGHQVHALEATADSVINTLWLSPV